jgi:hypothetical protein
MSSQLSQFATQAFVRLLGLLHHSHGHEFVVDLSQGPRRVVLGYPVDNVPDSGHFVRVTALPGLAGSKGLLHKGL